VRPPGSGSGNEVIISQVTPTAIISQGTRTATPTSPTATTPTAVAVTTGTPQPTATAGPREYFVQSGDTLIGIATQFAPPGVDPFIYAQQIAAASGLPSVDESIITGERLVLP